MDAENITQSPALRANAAVSQIVAARNIAVSEEVTLPTAVAEWTCEKDSLQRDVLVLTVKDTLGAQASGRFAPEELSHEAPFRQRLRELLGAAIRVGAWRQQLNQFFEDVRRWVQHRDPPPIVRVELIELNEARCGPYEVPSLHLGVNGAEIDIEPVGSWVVGANGRVDLHGVGGHEVLILDLSNQWQWVSDRPDARLQPLNEQLFLQLVDDALE